MLPIGQKTKDWRNMCVCVCVSENVASTSVRFKGFITTEDGGGLCRIRVSSVGLTGERSYLLRSQPCVGGGSNNGFFSVKGRKSAEPPPRSRAPAVFSPLF